MCTYIIPNFQAPMSVTHYTNHMYTVADLKFHNYKPESSINVTGPAKIGHVGSQNLIIFQTFGSHNILFRYGTATKISELVDNLFGFRTLLTETKYYISALRYVLSNDVVYFSPHALFSQARSQILIMVYCYKT